MAKEKCCAQVSGEGAWGVMHQHRCRRYAVVTREGKPYCKVHDPEFIANKREARDRRWNEEKKARELFAERQRLLFGIFEGIDNKTIEERIANKECPLCGRAQ